jgi:hypothetical protein
MFNNKKIKLFVEEGVITPYAHTPDIMEQIKMLHEDKCRVIQSVTVVVMHPDYTFKTHMLERPLTYALKNHVFTNDNRVMYCRANMQEVLLTPYQNELAEKLV